MNSEEIREKEEKAFSRQKTDNLDKKRITRRDDKKQDPETLFYYALTRNVDLKKLHQNENSQDDKKSNIENKRIDLDKIEPIISNREFNALIELLNNKINKTNITNFGVVLDDIYENLTQIVLYLYKDEKSILDNSLAKKKKGYSSSGRYIYDVIEEIIRYISKEQKSINITPKYVERYMNFIYDNYSNIIPDDILKESIVQMTMTKDDKDKFDSTGDNEETHEDNLKIILDFYDYLLSNFNRKQISLENLNFAGRNLKCLNNEELYTLIDCIKNVSYKRYDEEEAKVLLKQIDEISRLYLDDMKQIKMKIIKGGLNTAQLQKNLDKIKKKSPQRVIKEPKAMKNKKRAIVFTGTMGTLIAFLGGIYIYNKVQNSKVTTINNENNITMENDDNIEVENDESIDWDNITEEENSKIKEYVYNLYYPVLYKKIGENGQLIERQAYVGLNSSKVQLEDNNTIFVAKENTDDNGQVSYTVPKTNVDKYNIIFPFTLAYAKDTIDLGNGQIIDKESNAYIIDYTENEQLEGTFKVLYNRDNISNICEMTREDIINKFNIVTDIVRKITINGEEISLYGYNIKAFKTKNDLVLQNPNYGIPGTIIPKGTVVTGFSYKDKNREKVLIFYKDPNTLELCIDYQQSRWFESDIKKMEEDCEIQYIGEFVATSNMPASNGQSIIICEDGKELTLDLYLSKRQMVVKSPDGSINEISNREIPYIQKTLDSIWLDNPKLKAYAETCLIDGEDEYEAGVPVQDIEAEEPKPEEIITPEIITPTEIITQTETNIPLEQETVPIPQQAEAVETVSQDVVYQQPEETIDLGEER